MKEIRKIAVVMFTDIVGYSKIMSENESYALKVLDNNLNYLNKSLQKHNGILIKNIGDGTMSIFESAVEAVKCGKEFISEICSKCEFKIRIGIHMGDVVMRNNDVFGEGVNIASRLETLSDPDTILMSKEVKDQLDNHRGFESESIGMYSIKGVGKIIEVYRISNMLNKNSYNLTGRIDKSEIIDNNIPSLAILPFKNMGQNEDEFYSFGITHDLISDLANVNGIKVCTLEQFDQTQSQEVLFNYVTSQYSVRYVITGKLWKRKNLSQISIELFDTMQNKILWSDHWYEDTKNLYKIKSNVAEGILRVLNIDINKHKDVCNTVATISEAYSLYLKGKYIFQHNTKISKLKLSEKYLKQALDMDNKLLKAQLLLGDVLKAQNEFEKALIMYNNCLKSSKDMGRKIEIARCLSSIGDIYASNNEFGSAYEFQYKSLQIREEVDDIKGIGFCYNSLGNISIEKGEAQDAISYYKQSLEIRNVLGNKHQIKETIDNIALAYKGIGDNDLAEKYNIQSQSIDKDIKSSE